MSEYNSKYTRKEIEEALDSLYELDVNGYEYVDMGEAGIWAKYPLGVSEWNEESLDKIKYFAWGETEGYTKEQVEDGEKQFSPNWSDYKFGGNYSLTKYNSHIQFGTIDNKALLEPEDDACVVNMGGAWRMPTQPEFQKLCNSCDTELVNNYNNSGVDGILFKLKTNESKQLFFPFAGYYDKENNKDINNKCRFWSSSLYEPRNDYGCCLSIYSIDVISSDYSDQRYLGFCIVGLLDSPSEKYLTRKEAKITYATKEELNNVDGADWEAQEGEPGFIKNKPFGEILIPPKEVFWQKNITLNRTQINFKVNGVFSKLVPDKAYDIKIQLSDNSFSEEYTVTPIFQDSPQAGTYVFTLDLGPNSSASYIVMILPYSAPDQENMQITLAAERYLNKNINLTITESGGPITKIKKIDKEYLPDITVDWGVEEGENGYIENKPFYEKVTKYVDWQGDQEINFGSNFFAPFLVKPNSDLDLTVFVNDLQINCRGYNETVSDDSNIYIIRNYEGEPRFYALYFLDDYDELSIRQFPEELGESFNLWKVEITSTFIQKLDPKFVDLTEYTTKEEVTSEIETSIKGIGLDDYVTKEEIKNVVYGEEVVDEDTFEEFGKVTREELKKDLFIDMWNRACQMEIVGSPLIVVGKYNEDTGFFELNGITDITYEEALDIYRLSAFYQTTASTSDTGRGPAAWPLYGCHGSNLRGWMQRTYFPIPYFSYTGGNCYITFAHNRKVETIAFYSGYGSGVSWCFLHQTFINCMALREIQGTITTIRGMNSTTFESCSSLETVKLNLSADITNIDNDTVHLEWSPKLNYESLSYTVNAGAYKPTVINVHPDIYNAMTGTTTSDLNGGTSEQWQQLALDAASKNITFATV